jgi:hypothetical protein
MITKKTDKSLPHHFDVFCRRGVKLLFGSVRREGGSLDSIYEVVAAFKKTYKAVI